MNDKVIVITGASGGLGSSLVRYLLENNVNNLACHYRTEADSLQETFKQYGLSEEKHLFKADLISGEDVARFRAEIEDRLGPVDVVINLAGGSTNGVSWKLSEEDFRNVLDMNLMSTFLCCKEFIPGMRERASGRIINVSSVVAFSGVAGASHYCAAKAGIVGFTKAIAKELASKNICCNALALGYFDRGLIDHVPDEIQKAIQDTIPLKRFGTPNEIGGLLKFLMSDDGGYVTGEVFHLNGGLYS